jgi:hypothetical protein
MGTGRHLVDDASRTVSEDHLHALRLFIIEEQEHARLIALVCSALEIPMLDDHWTERVFRSARLFRGFRLELLVMLIAEIITARVYELIAAGVGDPTLSRLFSKLHADELRHLEFHAATVPAHLRRLPVPVLAAARTAWLAAAAVATIAVAVEHRSLVRACGTSPLRFVRDTIRIIRSQERRFFRLV